MSHNKIDSVDAIIVAGGAGSRLGAVLPKAFVNLHGKPLYQYSLDTFLKCEKVNNIILVVPDEWIEKIADTYKNNSNIKVTNGGVERPISVYNGCKLCVSEWVLVHDAARPFITESMVSQILEKGEKYESVIPVSVMADTVRFFQDDKALDTVDRTKLARVGTPQFFKVDKLKIALEKLIASGENVTDEAVLMQRMGIDVGVVWVDSTNFKVTHPSDLLVAEAILCYQEQSENHTNKI